MQRHIQIVNYIKDSIPDIEKSKFYGNMEFNSIDSARELDFPSSKKSPDIVIIFLQQEKADCLNKIAYITKTNLDKEIIAALPQEMMETGVKALQSGASDFFTLPSTAHTLDFYINRSLERNYLHQHICFNDSCYKSRYAISEKNYKHLFNEVPCYIYVVDSDFQITDCNRKFEEYFGSHLGEYCFGILKNRDEPCTKCTVAKSFKDGKNHASEMQIISSDGVKRVVLSWVAPIRDDQGAVAKAVVMLTDITEARRLEDHLTSLGFMIGSISHGIKGLLTSMDGGIYMMEQGFRTDNPEKIKQGFDMSKEMTSRIRKLVLDILYYTKTRKMAWEKIPVTLFVKNVLDIISAKAEQHNVTIESRLDIDKSLDIFEVDENSLLPAIVNIFENGIEACADNIGETQGIIRVHVEAEPDMVYLTIRDNGPGMDKNALKNIFTIFFSSKGNKGTGLGLYIANKVVTQHRGKIKVSSNYGSGTEFSIKIPRTVPDTARHPRGVAFAE